MAKQSAERASYGARGSQYCSHDYQKILRRHGFRTSMSGKVNCYDNAAVEPFCNTLPGSDQGEADLARQLEHPQTG